MSLIDPPAIAPNGGRPAPRWSNLGTRCIGIGQPATITLNAAGESYNHMIALETAFDAVRIVYMNTLAAAKTVGPVKVAPVAASNNPHATGATYTAVTFDGGAATGSVPAGTGPLPSFKESDWIELSSIARTDGGLYPLLAIFTFLPAANTSYAMTGGVAAWGTGGKSLEYSGMGDSAARRWWQINKQNGDYATSPSTWPNVYTVADYGPVAMVQFRARGGRIITVLGLGDSIMQGAYAATGQGSGNDQTQPNQYATPHITTAGLLASTPALPVTVANVGISGQTTYEYGARLARMLDLVDPTILAYPPFSPNTSPPLTHRDPMIRQTSQVLATCAARRVVPILLTSIPSFFGSTDDAARVTINTVTKGTRGVLVADHDGLISDGATPPRIAPAFQAYITATPDSTHPNGMGHYTMARATAACIRRVLASGFAA